LGWCGCEGLALSEPGVMAEKFELTGQVDAAQRVKHQGAR
jgi:hypothetical protein